MPQVGDVREAPQPTTAQRRQAERLANTAKNDRRRAAKAAGGSKKATDHAKELRHAFGGAFGKAPETVYETCRVGTTSAKRVEPEPWPTEIPDALYDPVHNNV